MHPLKRARVIRDMKQSELAEAAGVTQQAVSKIERGIQNGAAKTLLKLAGVMDTTIEEILGVADTPKVPAPILSLRTDQRRLLLGAIAGKGYPALPGELDQLAEVRRDAIAGGMRLEGFNSWFRRASAEDVRDELLPEESKSLEEELVGKEQLTTK